jgi:DNA end-binding protein Ku
MALGTPHAVGSFTLGISLVNVAVKAYKAIESPSKETAMRQLHNVCSTPIKQINRCEKCNVNVNFADLIKGVAVGKDSFVVITPQELTLLKTAKSDHVAILQFVDEDEVDSIYFEDGIYFLSPEKGHAGSFATVRDGLQGKLAIGDYSTGGHDHRVAIGVFDKVMVMRYLRPHAEVRTPVNIPQYDNIPVESNPTHTKLMAQLISTLTSPFDPTAVIDSYAVNFHKLVEAKVAGTAPNIVTPTAAPKAVVDLMSQLAASLAAVKKPEPAATTVQHPKAVTRKKRLA